VKAVVKNQEAIEEDDQGDRGCCKMVQSQTIEAIKRMPSQSTTLAVRPTVNNWLRAIDVAV
jgi:hypothetical protein